MRVLQIGSDRSRRGILFPGTPAFQRQEAYARVFGNLDIIAFSRRSDGANTRKTSSLCVYPTNSISRFLYWLDAINIARKLPRPDVVSVQDPFETGLTGLLIARMRKVPLHVQVHTDFLSPEYARLSLMNHARVFIVQFVLHRAARVRVVSKRIKDSIEMQCSVRAVISVLPIFVDLEKFRNAQGDAMLTKRFSRFKTKLLVVSRLEPEKNVALALDSFANAPLDSCLIIVGSGGDRNALAEKARIIGIFDRVFFEGEHDPAPYYRIADLVLFTSRYDGYGLVIVEALAAGVPVLSTDVGVAREAGAIVATPERFPEALLEWFQKGPREGRLSTYPYAHVDDYVQSYCADVVASVPR